MSDRSQKSSGALGAGIGGGQICGSRNSCHRQSSDAELEPFLEDASQQAPEPVKRRLKRNPKSLKKYTKIEKKADGFKKEK